MKPGYKQTEAGVIPEDWDAVLLDKVAKRGSGHTPNKKHPEYWNGVIKWISLADSNALDNLYISDTYAKITPLGITNSSAVLHPAGTVVLSRDAGIGKSAIMSDAMAVSQHFMAWQCGSKLNNKYLYYWLQREKPEFERIGNGSTIKTIGLSYFRDLKIPLPPLPEQRAIAEALSDVDGLLGGLDRLIAKKRDLKQAAMQQLLTGQTRLPGFHGEWEVKRLGQVAHLQNGYAFKSETYNPIGDFKIITIANVQDGFMEATECSRIDSLPSDLQPHQRLQADDILISMTGNVGRVCRVNELKCLLNQRVGKLITIGFDSKLLFFILGQRRFIRSMATKAKGGAQGNLSVSDITEFEFPAPRSESEQTAIAQTLSDMDAELTALEQRREKTRDLKQAMMQELLTGRTRLV